MGTFHGGCGDLENDTGSDIRRDPDENDSQFEIGRAHV